MKKCVICGKEHKRTCQTCCKECNEIYKKHKDNEQQNVIKEQGGDCCKICGRYTHGMFKHLKSAHELTVEEYNLKYDDTVKKFTEYWRKQNSGHTFKKGKDNPAYGHGGRLSPFSNKFLHKDKVNVEEVKAKAAQSRRDHPENDSTRIEYWLIKTNGDYEEAKRLLSERQSTFSREKCIERYGLKNGIEKWEKRQIIWLTSKYDKEGEELRKSVSTTTSKLEDEIIDKLISFFPNLERQHIVKHSPTKVYAYDIKIDNLLIEVNGDFYHMNPRIYDSHDINPVTHKKAMDVWFHDMEKLDIARKEGFKVYTLWEYDYRNQPLDTIVEEIKKKLN